MMHSKISLAFIRGKQIDLDNVHEQLYRKYVKKYGLD